MKTTLALLALVSAFSLQPSALVQAATTIDATNRCAYAANLGWVDWRGDTNNGAVIGEYVCSGYLYSANVGWISLGGGSPANGIYYQNLSAGDFGVNQDGAGNLTGYAWGANIGWITFEPTYGAPKVDLYTGKLSGFVWSANCGWISLSNATAIVQTDAIRQGALAPNGLPVAWLLQHFNTTNVSASADADGDGVNNYAEYLAGTDPRDASSVLRITSVHRGLAGDSNRVDMVWTSVASRQYAIQYRSDLTTNAWTDFIVFPWLGGNNAAWDDSASQRFYRVCAFRPLTP
jgi:hypothetical protein